MAQAATAKAEAKMEADAARLEADEAKTRAELDKARARTRQGGAGSRGAVHAADSAQPDHDFVWINEGGPRRAVLGVQIDPASGKEGARVLSVSPGGAAAEAGLAQGRCHRRARWQDDRGQRRIPTASWSITCAR